MGRKQRDLDMSGGPVAEFAAQLRAAREAAGNPTFAAMSRRAHRSISALSEAAGGVEFPTWATVEAFVHACGQQGTAEWRGRWEAAQAALARPAFASAAAPAVPSSAVDGPGPEHPASGEPFAAPEPRRRPRTRLRTWVALLVGLAVGVPVGAVLNGHPARGSAAAPTTGTPSPMPSVVIAPAPSPPAWPAQGSGCQARTHWVYQFAQSYAGQVYVQLASPTAESRAVPTSVTWGLWAWQRSVTVHPGDPAQAAGGTVLLFSKLDTSVRNPFVEVDTAAPVCAVFGTASGTAVAPLATVDANLGWQSASPTPSG